MAVKRAFGLPLLTKELLEQSARFRTYLIRSIYAILLFGIAILIFWGSVYSNLSDPLMSLGKGREMFMILMVIQTCGIILFTPALTCGAITTEKERNTIGLLFLTRLGPWAILMEKYLGRLVLMGTFLLISLPLFGFCYALGGVEQQLVWYGFYALIVTVIQLSALGLFCSAYFRTTVNAFIATYLIGFLMLFGPVFAIEFLDWRAFRWIASMIWTAIDSISVVTGHIIKTGAILSCNLLGIGKQGGIDWDPVVGMDALGATSKGAFLFFSPPLIIEATDSITTKASALRVISLGIPSLASGLFFLVLARLCLVRRAFVSPQRYLVKFFQLLDRFFHHANQNRLTRGIVLFHEPTYLPAYEPIAWRETTKTALGSFRYLIRIFVALEFPVVVVAVMAIANSEEVYYRSRHGAITFLVFLCWIIAILLTVIRAATLISRERAHETLDVLLTTPITSKQLISQKFRGVTLVMIVVSIPLLTAMGMQAWYCSIGNSTAFEMSGYGDDFDESAMVYLLVSFFCTVICLPLFAWVSFFLGMWLSSTTKAIFASLALIVAWMVLPIVLLVSFFEILHVSQGSDLFLFFALSPAIVPFFTEIGEFTDFTDDPWVMICLHLVGYGALLAVVRYLCLKNGARLLGRSEDNWS